MSRIVKPYYLKKVDAVLDYVYDNLEKDCSLERISEVACMSAYHWHRVYYGIARETIFSTVKRLRLEHAAIGLLESDKSLELIAKHAGYSTYDGFARAFKGAYQATPVSYRKRKLQKITFSLQASQVERPYHFCIKREVTPPIKLMCKTGVRGKKRVSLCKDYHKLQVWGDQLARPMHMCALQWVAENSMPPERYWQPGVRVRSSEMAYDGYHVVSIGAMPCISIEVTGSYAELARIRKELMRYLTAHLGVQIADKPYIEFYENDSRHCKPIELKTKMCVPIQGSVPF